MNKLRDLLEKEIVIFDGPIGTELYKKHFFVNVSYDNLCLTNPDVVEEIHAKYKEAGSQVFLTNTFRASPKRLKEYGLSDKVREINFAAVNIVKKVIDENDLIGGSICGTSPELDSIIEQEKILEEAGVDFIIFESIYDLSSFETCIKAAQELTIPYVVSCSFNAEGTLHGDNAVVKYLNKYINKYETKPTAFGMNCCIGPEEMLPVFEKIRKEIKLPFIIRPQLGSPKTVDGRLLNLTDPEYFTTYMRRFVELGARGIGGCCGVTSKHIEDMVRSIKPMVRPSIVKFKKEIGTKDEVPIKERSLFAKKLFEDEFVKTVEILPPIGFDLSATIDKAKKCKEAGIDAINIPDGPRASCRLSTLITALRIKEQAGIEPIIHQCCRDRNLIGIQSELLGCASAGINNILFITGDPPKLGDYPKASGVFDIDSIEMIKLQRGLNRGVDAAGKPIPQKTSAFFGSGADPNAINFDREIQRTKEKIESGALFIITQPVFDFDAFRRFLERVPELSKIKLIAGIYPFINLKNALFMKNNVPGVVVPDSIIERMSAFELKEDQMKEGMDIAREMLIQLKPYVNGIQISAPLGKVEIPCGIFE